MSHLHVSPDAPALIRYAADAVLVLHIGAGATGIISGFVALLARKGERVHRAAGTVFFVAILIMATIGASVSPFLPVPEMVNVAAGTLALYLVATSWVTIRRTDGGTGLFEIGGFVVALAVIAAGVTFILVAKHSATGTVGALVLLGAIAAACDLKVILRRGISGEARIARHLWRMCFALTIASGSFFLGQQRIMPTFMQGSPWLFVPVLAPLLLMVFWLIRVRLTGWFKSDPIAA